MMEHGMGDYLPKKVKAIIEECRKAGLPLTGPHLKDSEAGAEGKAQVDNPIEETKKKYASSATNPIEETKKIDASLATEAVDNTTTAIARLGVAKGTASANTTPKNTSSSKQKKGEVNPG
jgi:hypothetical protein